MKEALSCFCEVVVNLNNDEQVKKTQENFAADLNSFL